MLVPYRTLHRFCVAELEFGGQRKTVRVAGGEPGQELQVDFGRMGLLKDGPEGWRRLCWALIFTACYSRHLFCWLSFRQTLPEVVEGCEQAWRFFGGVFGVIIPDSLKAIVIEADPIAPRFNQAFLEYAQARRFEIDPARIRRPTDKPRVERVVNFVRESGFRGEVSRYMVSITSSSGWVCTDGSGPPRRLRRSTQPSLPPIKGVRRQLQPRSESLLRLVVSNSAWPGRPALSHVPSAL